MHQELIQELGKICKIQITPNGMGDYDGCFEDHEIRFNSITAFWKMVECSGSTVTPYFHDGNMSLQIDGTVAIWFDHFAKSL